MLEEKYKELQEILVDIYSSVTNSNELDGIFNLIEGLNMQSYGHILMKIGDK